MYSIAKRICGSKYFVTRKERVYAAVSHRAPDRVPRDYLATQTSDARLRQFLNVHTEVDLLDALGCDFYYLSARDISQNESTDALRPGFSRDDTATTRICPFGIVYHRSAGTWKFGADEAIDHPLKNAETESDILAHPMPDPTAFDFDPLIAECETYADRAIIGGFWSAIFGNAYRLMGYENFLYHMAIKPELTTTLVARLTDFYLALNDRFCASVNGKIDMFFFGNDFGTQNGPMFGRDMWLEHFYEPYKALIQLAKSYGLISMTHSCGSITHILPDLIDAGVDIIDPVQTTASHMDPGELKKQFGDSLTFHGAIDTQEILPHGTTEEIAVHVAEQVRAFGGDGGYILAPCNNIQEDTPPENVVAMYQAAE